MQTSSISFAARYKTDTTKQQTNISPLVMRIEVNITESLMGLHFTEKLKQHFLNNLLRYRELVPDMIFIGCVTSFCAVRWITGSYERSTGI